LRAPTDNRQHMELEQRMLACGILTPPTEIVADGKIHRFVSAPDHKSATGWYIVHPDPIAATWAFGDFRLGIKERGEDDPDHVLEPDEIADRRQRLAELARKIAYEEQRFQAGAAIEAQERWDRCQPAIAHAYLKSKGIDPCGTRIDGDRLLVPMRDITGKLWSLQEIAPDGFKHNQPGGRRKGCFFQIGEIGDTFCVGEGFSTCATIHKATGFAVMSAGEAGNLEAVARVLREKYPDATLVVAGDDDWLTSHNGKPHNTGKLAAKKTAQSVGGVLALPWFGPARPQWATDFNDEAKLAGIEEVATSIRLALTQHEESAQAAQAAEPPPATGPEDFGLPLAGDKDEALGVTLADLHAYMPQHCYIFEPTREMWPASSVNARIAPIPDGSDNEGKPKRTPASTWLDRHKPVEQMTWAPGLPTLIRNRLIAEGGWIERDGVTTFNLYRPPTIALGNAAEAGRWFDHVVKVFGDNASHVIYWLAHRVQRPHEKINHALVLGGNQGIGKDTLLEPVKQAIGPWNFCEVSPQHVLSRFNGFLKSVILRISEARDLGDVNRFSFYDHSKAFTAAPPDVLRVDEKNLREHAVLNVTGVIITSNHKTDGIFLPADDRRHFVAWSELTKDDFSPGYWNDIWRWYAAGGNGHVAAYLATLDLSPFDPKAPPPKTEAFWAIVDASRAPEDAELADVLDSLGNPEAVTIARIASEATGAFTAWITDRKNRRAIPHRMEQCGYVAIRNDSNKEGIWIVHGTRQVIYAKAILSIRDRFIAARRLAEGER
jgi:phage/plasmid primase-like uncharacterized protein